MPLQATACRDCRELEAACPFHREAASIPRSDRFYARSPVRRGDLCRSVHLRSGATRFLSRLHPLQTHRLILSRLRRLARHSSTAPWTTPCRFPFQFSVCRGSASPAMGLCTSHFALPARGVILSRYQNELALVLRRCHPALRNPPQSSFRRFRLDAAIIGAHVSERATIGVALKRFDYYHSIPSE
jgi:hypothetical protein